MGTGPRVLYEFGPFRVDPANRQLLRDNQPIAITPKAFEALLILLRHSPQVISKDELMKELWPDTFVEEANLSQNIFLLRKALGDNPEGSRYIVTLPRLGYRFAAGVRTVEQNGGDLVIASHTRSQISLEQTKNAPSEVSPAPLTASHSKWNWKYSVQIAALIAISVAASIFFAIAYQRSRGGVVNAVVTQILAPPNTVFQFGPAYAVAPTLSPDGRRLVFLATGPQGQPMLWVRSLDSNEARPLEGTENAATPFWSPDGEYVAFFAEGKLKKVAVSGGQPVDICGAPNGRGGAWSADGTILFTPTSESPLFRVPASGGTPTPVTAADEVPQEEGQRWPQFLPDDRHFLFYAASESPELSGATYVGSLDGGKPKLLLSGATDAIYAPPGYLVFQRDGGLMAQRFNAARLELTGDPVQIADRVRVLPTAWYVMVTASQNGILAYVSGAGSNGWQLAWFDASGKEMGTTGGTQFFRSPHLSPDGKEFAVAIGDLPAYKLNIWIYNLAHGTQRRLTFNQSQIFAPLWSPDGTKLAFFSSRNGKYYLDEKPTDGSSPAQPLIEDTSLEDAPASWSPDGRYIAFTRSDMRGGSAVQIWMLPLFGNRKPFPFLNGNSNEDHASFSPNGKWVAYVSDESGRNEVYIVPFPKRGGRWQVSTEGGEAPHWRRDGKELFYVSPTDKLMAVEILESGKSLRISSTRTLFQIDPPASHWADWRFDVTADGKKFIVVTRQPEQPSAEPVTLVVNWQALLKQKQ
jgi:eukaryotic-like serine/threonine-protein kinase